MNKKRTEETIYPVWIDETKRIVSFKKEVGFQKILFASEGERLQFAIEKSSSGYRIQ